MCFPVKVIFLLTLSRLLLVFIYTRLRKHNYARILQQIILETALPDALHLSSIPAYLAEIIPEADHHGTAANLAREESAYDHKLQTVQNFQFQMTSIGTSITTSASPRPAHRLLHGSGKYPEEVLQKPLTVFLPSSQSIICCHRHGQLPVASSKERSWNVKIRADRQGLKEELPDIIFNPFFTRKEAPRPSGWCYITGTC